MKRLLLATILLLIVPRLYGQICEDFADGDLTGSPSWLGATTDFRINADGQLQLNAQQAGTSCIAFPYAMPNADTITWELWVRLAFAPSTNNYTEIYLIADSADLQNSAHCLSVAITDPTANDKVIGLKINHQQVIHHTIHTTSNNKYRIKVQRIDSILNILIDTVGEANAPIFDVVIPNLHMAETDEPDNPFFGICCIYTQSRANKFYFDDIGINCDHFSHQTEPDSTESSRLVPGDVLVNEVLFNPPPGGADYVELYNNSDSAIALAELHLARMVGDSVTRLYPIAQSGALPPHDYLVVTTDAAYVSSAFDVRHPEKLVELTAMPAYNDASGTVALCRADTLLLDSFSYTESMHSRLLRSREGVALERRSHSSPTNEASNWYSAASTAGFGTPTYANSQSKEFLFVDDDFNVEHTLFSPDGDGYNDLLDITYRLNDCSLSSNITIFDKQGRKVCRLANGILLGCQGNLTWDGLGDNGHACPRGNYLIVIEVYNESGVSQSWRRTISLVR
ncbi:MAG: lamin tail domain-containing protein [Bacteroidales bacterium]|nr:lamin tail domain-containing protein [Bacteroidales bacterium]